ncbi:MAG: DUF898 family protein, partial [Casimicrobium sp.]
WLIVKSLKFHMANSSYRNVRFRFLGETKDAYIAFYVPILALIGLGIVAGLASFASKALAGFLVMITLLVFYAVMPYVQYRMRRFSTNGARAGTSPFSFHVTVGQYYIPFFIAIAFMIVLGVIFGVVISMFFGASMLGAMANPEGWMKSIGIGFFVFLALFYLALLAVGPLLISLLQNTVWSGTALEGRKFKSQVPVGKYMLTWVGVTLLTVITLGLYRPFAAVKLAKMQVEAVSWHGSAQDLQAITAKADQRAMGSEVADLMDVDIGL